MICEKCGNWVEDGESNCPGCGAPVMAQGGGLGSQMNTVRAEGGPVNTAAKGEMGENSPYSGYTESQLNRKGFYKHPNVSSLSRQIKACAIAMYILAGLNLGFYLFLSGRIFVTLESVVTAVVLFVFLLGLGLGIHLGQSRICAVILTVYGVYNAGVSYINSGKFSGWAFLLVGCYALSATFKFQKAWKKYKNTGIVPFVAGR